MLAHRSAALLLTGVLVFDLSAFAQGAPSGSPAAAAGAAPSSPYRVLHSTSGTQGEIRNGRYVVLDPRTHFQVPRDTQIIVYFSWLGPPGAHKLSGTWRGPRDTSTTTEFDYTASDRQFGAYWLLKLPPDIPTGQWTLEARIDGHAAGVHAFEISAEGEAPPPAVSLRKLPLTRAELYQRGVSALVSVDAIDAGGARLDTGLGFRVDEGLVLTTFAAVNGASVVRVRDHNGKVAETREVAGLNFRNGWALLALPGTGTPGLTRAAGIPDIGLPCVSFEAPSEGARAIVTGEISGVSEVAGLGPRLSITFSNVVSSGAPVLDEFGTLIGFVPTGPIGDPRTATPVSHLYQLPPLADGTVVPINAIRPFDDGSVPLDELARRSMFLPRVTADREVLSGGFSVSVQRAGPRTQPVDQRNEFSQRDPSVTAFVTWYPQQKYKGTAAARVYDLDNRLLLAAKPSKVSFRPGDMVFSSWQLSVPNVAGVFRVDVLLGEQVAWRGFFRVVD